MDLFNKVLEGMFSKEELMEILKNSKVVELKPCAKIYGIKGYYKLRKVELVKAIYEIEIEEREELEKIASEENDNPPFLIDDSVIPF